MEILGRPGDEVLLKVKILSIHVTSNGTYYDLTSEDLSGDFVLKNIPEDKVSEIQEPERAQEKPKKVPEKPKKVPKDPENAQEEPKRRGRPRKATIEDLMKAAEKKRKPDPLTDVLEKIGK